MTISKYGHFTFIPKRCDKCGRLFIFEGYHVSYKYVFWSGRDLEEVICRRCLKERRKINEKLNS